MIDPQGPSGGGQLGQIPYLRLPQPEILFARRADRFAALAPGNTLSEYLELLGRIARAQLVAYETVFVRPSTGWCRTEPDAVHGEASSVPGEPVEPRPRYDVTTHHRAPEWQEALRVILTELSSASAPPETGKTIEFLNALAREELEAIADRVLSNAAEGTDLAAGPFVAAALQVYFTALASRVTPASVARAQHGCPICGSLPVVGVVLADDPLRYLVCSVCATQWHHTRLQCTACGNSEDLAYYALEGERAASVPAPNAVKAEACPSCKTYTKLFYLEQDPRLEPFADDVATLALDLLMAENGWARHGVNVFLIPAAETGR